MSAIIREKPLEAKKSTIDELNRLKALTSDNQVILFLEREVNRQELDLENRKKIEEMAEKIEIRKENDKTFKEAPKILKQSGFKRKAMSTYAWDQAEKKLKFYLKGVDQAKIKKEENVKILFDGDNKISILLTDEESKLEYFFDIPVLFGDLDSAAKQLIKLKADKVFISLSKKEASFGTWAHLTCKDKKAASAKADKMAAMGGAGDKEGENADPQASIMNMMKNMYEDGDDEMKRTINKAWEQAQNKKDGMGGMPGMGGMGGMPGMGGMGM